MIIINTPLKAEVFQKIAEDEGLVFLKKSGMKLQFENPAGDDAGMAAALKKKCKEKKELSAIYFQVLAE